MPRILLATLVSMIALTAQAAVQQQTVVFGPSVADLTNTTLTVAPFNTILGQLTSVGLTLAASSNVSGTVTNTAAQANPFRISANTDVKLTSTPGTGIAGLTVSLGSAQDFTGLAPGATGLYGPNVLNGAKSGAGTPLSAFTAGPITFAASTISTFIITGAGGNTSAMLATTAGGALTVFYTYDPFRSGQQLASIPEPETLALLGVGLLGVGFLRRRM